MSIDFDIKASPQEWWASKRIKYNVGLVVAGICAFICYCFVFDLVAHKLGPEADITLFTTMFQGFGYLVMMVIANICYNVGPFIEKHLKPKDIVRYRKTAFSLGFWCSVALPFSIPILVFVKVVLSP